MKERVQCALSTISSDGLLSGQCQIGTASEHTYLTNHTELSKTVTFFGTFDDETDENSKANQLLSISNITFEIIQSQ